MRISSTGSGSGAARKCKFFDRKVSSIVKNSVWSNDRIKIINETEYSSLQKLIAMNAGIFECSQGALLDTNFGIYPYVTSRTTLPRAAIERNGLGWLPWLFCGVYRTYPIRTGGPSGPTEGAELSWDFVGVEPEVATVTKRKRRVFAFSEEGFCKSIRLTRPDVLMFTFEDYLTSSFEEWVEYYNLGEIRRMPVYVSHKTGQFRKYTNNL